MNKKIFRSIMLVALLVLFASMVLIFGILYDYFDNRLEAELITEAEYISYSLKNPDNNFFEDFSIKDRRITLISADGTVLADTLKNAADMENHRDRKEFAEAISTGQGRDERYSETLTEKTIYYAVRLDDGNVLRVSTKQYTVITILLGLMQPTITVIAIAFVLSLLLSSKLTKSIVKPICNLDPDKYDNADIYEELKPLLRKISSLKRTIEEEALSREKMRREFTSNVSHELKTPLTSISGFAEIMKSGDTPSDVIVDFSKSIYDEAQRLIALVNDIIKISELDDGDIPYEPETVDLYELSKDIVKRLSPEAKKYGISIGINGGTAFVFGAVKILDEVIYNLVDNAIKYNRPNGSVSISISDTGNKIVLSVSDTGIGIPENEQDRVFERFYRIDKSHSKSMGGTGLGLSIVKHGAAFHNASLKLNSVVDAGTEISLIFDKDKAMNKSYK